MGPIDFTPLVYFGVLIGLAIAAGIAIVVALLWWLFSHMDIAINWIS